MSSAVSQATQYQQALIRSQDLIERERLEAENVVLRLQQEQLLRGQQAMADEATRLSREANVQKYLANAPSVEELQEQIAADLKSKVGDVDPYDLIRRNPTKPTSGGPRVGTVDAKMARGEKVSLQERQQNFQRTAEANQRAEALLLDESPSLKDIRAVRALAHLGPEQRRNLDVLIAQRTNIPLPARPAERVPVVTAEQLALVPVGAQASLGPDVIVGPASIPDPPQVDIPPPSNPPEPRGAGLQHVTAATFPASKWTTASSLRWLRSNGLHPIRKSTKINGAYSYALQSPVSYSSFNSVNMSHKNKDFTIVYGTPK